MKINGLTYFKDISKFQFFIQQHNYALKELLITNEYKSLIFILNGQDNDGLTQLYFKTLVPFITRNSFGQCDTIHTEHGRKMLFVVKKGTFQTVTKVKSLSFFTGQTQDVIIIKGEI